MISATLKQSVSLSPIHKLSMFVEFETQSGPKFTQFGPKRALSPDRVTPGLTSTLRITERHVIFSNDVFLLLSYSTY